MSCESDIRGTSTPQQALLVIAKYIDDLTAEVWEVGRRISAINPPATAPPADPWGTWSSGELAEAASQSSASPTDRPVVVEETEGQILLTLPAPSPERLRARLDWVTAKPGIETLFEHSGLNAQEFADAYAKGGPLWAYHGDRDAVMLMPMEWRRDMVNDIALDSPATAHEVGRDILKYTTEEAAQRAQIVAEEIHPNA